MFERREFLKTLGMGSGAVALGALGSSTAEAAFMIEGQSPAADRLYEELVGFPIDDTHCHPLTDKDAQTTPQRFLERLSLAAFPARSYFPSGVYRKWQDGDVATKRELDRQYGIEEKLAEIAYHFGESVFVKYMLKEMAQFLDCTPDLKTVIDARNERGRDYWRYVNDLFRDVKIENAMLDTGYSEGMDAAGIGRFEKAIAPSKSRRVYRVETIQRELFSEDISFEDLASRFVQMVRTGLDKDGNYGKNSYDMPMQFHAGDGEAPFIILRNQDPYFLEEVVRFDKDGVMRMPKIIPIHAGYPLVGKAAWLSHLYTNCYFELSIMTPLVHQGLFYRYMQVMEAVPLSKILFGSDAYNVPELYWLSGRWGKRYLAQALGVYVKNGSLTVDEALEAARMILYKNNRRVYNLTS